MTQNRFILGITSFLLVILALIYIVNPFEVPSAYASEKTFFDSNQDGIISGKIQTPNSDPLRNVPITLNGFDDKNNLVKIASGNSDNNGKFTFKINRTLIPTFHRHKIIILFTINGKTYKQTITLSLDDKTFEELFVDHPFLPSPPF